MWILYVVRVSRSIYNDRRSGGFTSCARRPSYFSLFTRAGRGAWFAPNCARPTRGVRDRALREHKESPGLHSFLFLLSPHLPLEGVGRWSSTARIEGPQFYRGASASKESHLPTSSSYFSYFSPPSREGTGALAGHPCLLQLRPSNEALRRARVPGARGQHGCPATLIPSSLSLPSTSPRC